MKKLIIACLVLAVSVSFAFAQMTPKGGTMVMEKKENMSLGTQNALVVNLEGVDGKTVGNVWGDFLKSYYGVKPGWERKQKEWFADDANIPAIGGATPIDIHAAANDRKGSVEFTVWFNFGNDFLNSRDYPEQYAEAQKLMESFITEVKKASTQSDLDDQQKELKKIEKELSKLESKNSSYHKEIEKAEKAIEQAKQNIQANEKEQEVMRQRIETQKETVKAVETKLKKIN